MVPTPTTATTATTPALARSVSQPVVMNPHTNVVNGGGATHTPATPGPGPSSSTHPQPATTATSASTLTYRLRLVPHLETYRSLHFEPVVRDVRSSVGPEWDHVNEQGSEGAGAAAEGGRILKIGRFTEKTQQQLQQQQQHHHQQQAAMSMGETSGGGGSTAAIQTDPSANPFGSAYAPDRDQVTAAALARAPTGGSGPSPTSAMAFASASLPASDRPPSGAGGGGNLNSNKVAFKSKVVSRAHAEIWVEDGGKVSFLLSLLVF